MAKKYVTNTGDLIDWDKVIDNLSSHKGEIYGKDFDYENPNTYELISKFGRENLEYSNFRDPKGEIYSAFINNTENLEFVAWTEGKGYSISLDRKIENLLGCKIVFSWITKVNPGKCVAPHVDDEEIYFVQEKYKNKQVVRYHIHISKPNIGAAFFIEEDCYYFEPQGSVFQWPRADGLHCGMNAGTKPKFVYHAIGVIDDLKKEL